MKYALLHDILKIVVPDGFPDVGINEWRGSSTLSLSSSSFTHTLSSANKGGCDFRDRATVDASPVVIGDFEVLLDEAAEQAERTREAQRRPPRRITAQWR